MIMLSARRGRFEADYYEAERAESATIAFSCCAYIYFVREVRDKWLYLKEGLRKLEETRDVLHG